MNASLDFFRNLGAIDFAGYPFDVFLYGVVRQLGESQPSVKHAALAFTAKCNSRAESSSTHFGDKPSEKQANDFALRQTSKSIPRLLQEQPTTLVAGRRAQREVVMAVCGILALLASIVGDLETSKMHLACGQRAMQEWRQQHANFDGSSIAPTLSAVLSAANCKVQSFEPDLVPARR